jgi:hypothetical protein
MIIHVLLLSSTGTLHSGLIYRATLHASETVYDSICRASRAYADGKGIKDCVRAVPTHAHAAHAKSTCLV